VPEASRSNETSDSPCADPARGTVIEELPVADGGAVAAAVHRARAAQAAGAPVPYASERSCFAARAASWCAIRRRFLTGSSARPGKARVDVVGELMGVCIESGHMMRRAARWLAR
jgi:acyl-CoA reductase-like NAD-dependent aldehyde dehydrogenase